MILPQNQVIIGLTGGIATGKTTVSNCLAQVYNLPIFDADIYARKAVEKGSPILAKIAQRYSNSILLPNSSLNRQQLGEIIFQDNSERQWLESQIHPFVRQCFQSQQLTAPINVFVIPLLFEASLENLVTQTWVVACSPRQQLKRLRERNNLSTEQAQNRISSQMPLSEKAKLADIVLDNSTTTLNLFKQIDDYLAKLRDHKAIST